MEENWYSLAISIVRKVTPEQAFGLLNNGKKPPIKLVNQELKAMGLYKRLGLTWKQIGEMYGLEESGAYKRYKRYKKLTSKVAI